MSLKATTAREYRTKYPDKPSHALARIMYKENKKLFKDVEDARSKLRYIEGKQGDILRKMMGQKEMILKEARPYNPYKLPDSDDIKREPFVLPLCNNNILVISDLHIPYHDVSAITAAFDYGKEKKVNTIFINGDLMDQHQLSRFINDPRKRNIKEELEITKGFLGSLRETFPMADIYYLKGNHCVRLELYMLQKAKELYDLDVWQLENLLELNKYKIKIIDDKVLVKMGKLSISHGHLIIRGIFAPVNSARGAYMKAKQSILIGHVHKVSAHQETNIDGDVVMCYSTGCLCQLKPDYSPLVSNYAHGFAHVQVENNGNYKVTNLQVIKGKIY